MEILTGSGGDSVLFARYTGGDSVLVNKKEWGGILSGGDFVLHSAGANMKLTSHKCSLFQETVSFLRHQV